MAATFIPEDQVPVTEEPEDQVPVTEEPAPAPEDQQGQAGNFVHETAVPEGSIGGGRPIESLSFLPMSRYPKTGWAFDPHAGVLGSIISAVTLPGDVMSGRASMDDPRTQQRAMEAASWVVPDLETLGPAAAAVRQPNFRAILDASDAGYKRAGGMGVEYRIPAVQKMTQQIRSKLYSMGIRPSDAPGTFGKLDDLDRPPEGAVSVPLDGLESFRKGFVNLSRGADADAKAAGTAMNGIDDFYASPNWASVYKGPAQDAAAVLKEARENWAAGQAAQKMDRVQKSAELRSEKPGADYAGLLQNKLRMLSDPLYPGRLAGFTQPERDAIVAASRPGAAQTAIAQANKLLGERGMLALMGERMGGITGAAIGAVVPPIASGALEKGSRYFANRAFQKADDLVRSRSPLARQQPAPLPGPDPRWAAPAIRALRVVGPAAAKDIQSLAPLQIQRSMIPATPGQNTPVPEDIQSLPPLQIQRSMIPATPGRNTPGLPII